MLSTVTGIYVLYLQDAADETLIDAFCKEQKSVRHNYSVLLLSHKRQIDLLTGSSCNERELLKDVYSKRKIILPWILRQWLGVSKVMWRVHWLCVNRITKYRYPFYIDTEQGGRDGISPRLQAFCAIKPPSLCNICLSYLISLSMSSLFWDVTQLWLAVTNILR